MTMPLHRRGFGSTETLLEDTDNLGWRKRVETALTRPVKECFSQHPILNKKKKTRVKFEKKIIAKSETMNKDNILLCARKHKEHCEDKDHEMVYEKWHDLHDSSP